MEPAATPPKCIRDALQLATMKDGVPYIPAYRAQKLWRAWKDGEISDPAWLEQFRIETYTSFKFKYSLMSFKVKDQQCSVTLLDHDIHETNNDGWQLIHRVAEFGERGVVELCLAAGADPNARTNDGLMSTPLVLCCRLEDMQTLLQHGADFPVANAAGRTPFHIFPDFDVRELFAVWEPYISKLDFINTMWEARTNESDKTCRFPNCSPIDIRVKCCEWNDLQYLFNLTSELEGPEALWERVLKHRLIEKLSNPKDLKALGSLLPELPDTIQKAYAGDPQLNKTLKLQGKLSFYSFSVARRLKACVRKLQQLGIKAKDIDTDSEEEEDEDADFDQTYKWKHAEFLKDTLARAEAGVELYSSEEEDDGVGVTIY